MDTSAASPVDAILRDIVTRHPFLSCAAYIDRHPDAIFTATGGDAYVAPKELWASAFLIHLEGVETYGDVEVWIDTHRMIVTGKRGEAQLGMIIPRGHPFTKSLKRLLRRTVRTLSR